MIELKRYASLGAVMLILAMTALLYVPYLHNPILFDDTNYTVAWLANYQSSITPWMSRWLPYASITWTWMAFGSDVYWVRVGNMALHAAVAISLYFFLKLVFQKIAQQEGAALPAAGLSYKSIALIGALLFALHPVAVYAAGYMMQRTIVMATLFSVIALFLYVKGFQQNQKILLWSSVFAYLLGVLSKEHVILLPSVMVVLTVLLDTEWISTIRRLWMVYIGYFCAAVWVVYQKFSLVGAAYEPDGALLVTSLDIDHPYWMSILTQGVAFFKYLGLWLLPNPLWMSGDMREPIAHSFFSIYGFALLVFMLWVALAIRLIFKRGTIGMFGLGMLIPAMLFATEFSSIRLQEPFVLYRSYFWMVALGLCLPLVISRLSRAISIAISVLVVLAMLMISNERLMTFSDPIFFWEDAAKLLNDRQDTPYGSYRIYNNLGNGYADRGLLKEALSSFQTAVTLEPKVHYAWANMGNVYRNMGDLQRTVDCDTNALIYAKSFPDTKDFRAMLFFIRGNDYLALNLIKEAKADWKLACDNGVEPACGRLKQNPPTSALTKK
ncbi:MAG: hypothetical protein PHP57_09525 [Sideroxydans sp.]|nr:hypothetical protein [Sideroxydans sp.]